MLLTLLVEHVIAQSASLRTTSKLMHSKNISERVWRPWSSLVCVPLSKHPDDLVDHQMLGWDAISHGSSTSTSIASLPSEESTA